MKRLPLETEVDVPYEKLLRYILSEAYPVGKWKVGFFRSVGIDSRNFDTLKKGLIDLARENDIVQEIESPHGFKYVVHGVMSTPSGTIVELRTIRARNKGSTVVRFVTTYPRKGT